MASDLPHPKRATAMDRLGLRADCAQCVGLCCVAPAFSASADFAIDKPAGVACPNLGSDFGCTIHSELRDRGFPGCTVYDCFGAGQKVVQTTFGARGTSGTVTGGADWRQDTARAAEMFQTFTVMRELHELLWYLACALTYPASGSRRPQVRRLLDATEQLTSSSPDVLAVLDVAAHRSRVNDELRQVSSLARAGFASPEQSRADGAAGPAGRRAGRRRRSGGRGQKLSGQDLMGRDLRHRDLRAADLRGAYLIGADLRGVDLTAADLIGADLRGADVRGADLRGALFVTQLQVNAARGDAGTRLPSCLARPGHWAVTTD